VAESFFATLEHELIGAHDWATHTQARQDIFVFIEEWYNRERQHSSLGYVSLRTVRAGSLRALGASSVNHVSVESSQVHVSFEASRTCGRWPHAEIDWTSCAAMTSDAAQRNVMVRMQQAALG